MNEVDEPYSMKSYKTGLAAVLVAYCLLYGWILISSDFIPYVMDGNESYSSLVHAYNLYHFDISKSAGLTDEAASPDPAAHPFSYTHQGNFPRLFAYLIYLLGARNIESQIVVTTLTVGLAVIAFAFTCFFRMAGPTFAITFSLLLMTDYLLFSQWQVQTARVWNGFFLFSSLLCVQGLGGPCRRRWTVLTILNSICLFYFQLIYAVFVAILTALYTAWVYRHNLKALLFGWTGQAAGMVISVAIMAAQLFLYLGWEDFLKDLQLTFVARSYASRDPAWLQSLVDFYSTRNIVFWYNLRSAGSHAGFVDFWHSIFHFGFLVHTPFLTLIVFLIFSGWVAGRAASAMRRFHAVPLVAAEKDFKALVVLAFPVALGLFVFVFKFVLEDARLTGELGTGVVMSLDRLVSIAALSLPLVAWLTTVFVRQAWNAFPIDGVEPAGKILTAGLYLLGAAIFASLQGLFYKQEWRILWADTLGPSHQWIALAVVSAALVFGLLLITLTPERLLQRGNAQVKHIMAFLVPGLLALAATYQLAPGYIYSGYLELYAPLLVFHIDCFFAVSLFILLSAGHVAFRKLRTARSLGRISVVRAWSRQPAMILACSLGIAGYFVVYWGGMQIAYAELFPYDSFAFMKTLRNPPYKGKSFVVNYYAIPTFSYTGEWAYYDSEIGKGIVTLTPEGFNVHRDLRELWFADRHTRPDYLKPEYFLCITGRTFQMIVDRLAHGIRGPRGCGHVELVKQASLNSASFPLRHRLLEQDESPNKSWAVVKLDWDYPPYLEPSTSGNGGAAVQLEVVKTSSEWVAAVSYQYRHQEGLSEGDTRVRIFGLEPRAQGGTEALEQESSRLLGEGIRQRRFILPRRFKGFIYATVSPATSTKIGERYDSVPIWVDLNENRKEHRNSNYDLLPQNWTTQSEKSRLSCSPLTEEGNDEEKSVFGGADCHGAAAGGGRGAHSGGDAEPGGQRSHLLSLAKEVWADGRGGDPPVAAA